MSDVNMTIDMFEDDTLGDGDKTSGIATQMWINLCIYCTIFFFAVILICCAFTGFDATIERRRGRTALHISAMVPMNTYRNGVYRQATPSLSNNHPTTAVAASRNEVTTSFNVTTDIGDKRPSLSSSSSSSRIPKRNNQRSHQILTLSSTLDHPVYVEKFNVSTQSPILHKQRIGGRYNCH
ncbi:hypothetical protein DOLIC_00116 [Dolichomitus sp. PSUC_FEM 10030005]|nr:hypothetical protein [Dolichomitus sp. PSUC_FEM 10030005]